MKFTCTKENLSFALGMVHSVAQKQGHLPILTNVLLDVKESSIDVIATNLEIAVKVVMRAKIDEPGSFTVPAKMLADYVALAQDEQLGISLEGTELVVRAGQASTKIKGQPADEFPLIPDVEEAHGYTVSADVLKTALSQTAIAASKNDIRPELAGVYAGFFTERHRGLVLAATDSYRLSEKRIAIAQGTDEFQCIVPAKTMFEMVRMLLAVSSKEGAGDARIWASDNQIALRYGTVEMTSRLVDGTYPDYAQIIPKNFKTTATVSVDELAKRIKAASLFTAMGMNAVSFDINASEGTIGVSSTSAQSGEHFSVVDAAIVGEENSILLNHRYVLDGLAHIETETADFLVNSGDSPCLFRPSGKDDFLYIVMPIRQ